MSLLGEVVIGLLILTGLAGIVIPVLPGLALVTLAVVVWAAVVGSGIAWTIAVVALFAAVAGTVVKFLVPVRRLRDSGVPRATMVFAGLLAIIGFFVLPVIGAPIGFVAGTYLAERRRLGSRRAGPSTRSTLLAVALAIGIELAAGLIIAGTWLLAVLFWA